MDQNTNTDTVSAIANVDKLLEEQKLLKKALKEKKALSDWEKKIVDGTDDRLGNKQYVVGSVREPTAKDETELGHVHGKVCEIKCQTCGVIRVINKQDAFQVRFCKKHKSEARKEKAKAKRQETKLSGKSANEIELEISALKAQLGIKEAQAETETAAEAVVAEAKAEPVAEAPKAPKAKRVRRARRVG